MQKEVLHIVRHPRSYWLYIAAIGIPFLLFALLLAWTNYLIKEQTSGLGDTEYSVAWMAPEGHATPLKKRLERDLRVKLVEGVSLKELPELLEKDSLQLGIVLANDFDSAVAQQRQTSITLNYYGSFSEALSVVESHVSRYNRELRDANLDSLNLSAAMLQPINIQDRNYFSMGEMLDYYFNQAQRSIAALLALLCLIFGILGAQYGLKRSFWMDKHSGTWFAILATGKARRVIFLRRFVLASLFSWVLMLLAAGGFLLALGIEQEGLFQKVLERVQSSLTMGVMGNIFIFTLPFAFLLTALWCFLGFYANKITYAIVNSLIFILLLAFFISMGWDGQELSVNSALLPFFSIIYVLVELLKEAPHWGLLGMAFVAGLGYASLLAYLSFLRFKSERFVTVV